MRHQHDLVVGVNLGVRLEVFLLGVPEGEQAQRNTEHRLVGIGARADGYEIRTAAVSHGIPCITTLPGILAAIQGIEALRQSDGDVRSLQDYHRELAER